MWYVIRDILFGFFFLYFDEVFVYLVFGLFLVVFDSNLIFVEIESGEVVESFIGIEIWGRVNLGFKMIVEFYEYYVKIGCMLIEFCVYIGKMEVICEDIYSRFEFVG